MNLGNNKDQKEPTQEVIKLILELFNSNKFDDAKKEIYNQMIKYSNSSILFNILGAVLSGQDKSEKAIENRFEFVIDTLSSLNYNKYLVFELFFAIFI